MNSLLISKSQAEKIVPGTSKQEVLDILTVPDDINPHVSGDQWIYSSSFRWYAFYIDFDKEGLVVQAYFDD